ncbi:hypothetical protein EJ05DRAFT_10242 [Pseudovirgaria hyperparasitica]|uniref:Uncharacterized protein n=1 Tax=Pseudovirgaria hyperparasitica TaxID=470096 RepID=A0A6A6WKM7_9PEZI|nr:uncharacterized protein EJ05DRAFT_10242 [Pseudovirgaria hyperparasitica]KAF2762711.1 hypothetical protein EJ05DRAFT_10242 [Pseudovirgaria hyperparasitica]
MSIGIPHPTGPPFSSKPGNNYSATYSVRSRVHTAAYDIFSRHGNQFSHRQLSYSHSAAPRIRISDTFRSVIPHRITSYQHTKFASGSCPAVPLGQNIKNKHTSTLVINPPLGPNHTHTPRGSRSLQKPAIIPQLSCICNISSPRSTTHPTLFSSQHNMPPLALALAAILSDYHHHNHYNHHNDHPPHQPATANPWPSHPPHSTHLPAAPWALVHLNLFLALWVVYLGAWLAWLYWRGLLKGVGDVLGLEVLGGTANRFSRSRGERGEIAYAANAVAEDQDESGDEDVEEEDEAAL